MRSALSMAAAATLLLGACSYDFKNPAERLDSGEVTGRVLADRSGTGELTAVFGATVQLRNSGNVQFTRDNGRFFMTGLVPGRHTLLLTEGTTWALQRDVELAWGSDGQPESILLGDLRLRRTVNMGGSFTVPIDGVQPVAPVAFVFDEATGARASAVPELDGFGNYTGRFTYAFDTAPVGPHRLRYAVTAYQYSWPTSFVGGPLTQEIPETSEGQSLTLTQPSLHVPVLYATGKLHFRVQVPIGAAMPTVVVAATSGGASLAGVPAPDSAGVFDWDVDEGIYFVRLDLGAAPGTLQAPVELQVVVVAGQTSELGTLYVVDLTAASRGDYACLDTSDCFDMYTCQDGTCVFGQPAGIACVTGPSIDSECSVSMGGCISTPPSSPVQCNGGTGVCALSPSSTWVCVPTGYPDCQFDIYSVPAPNCTAPF